MPSLPGVLSFAVVTSGRCWLSLGDGEPMALEQGALVLMTGGQPQTFRSDPSASADALEDLPVRQVTALYETLEHGGDGAETRLLYGIVRIDHAAGGLLMELLPDHLLIDSWTEDEGGWLRSTLQFMAREARALRPGGEAVLTRLADVVVIEAIRRWIAAAPEADGGWLGAVRDRHIGRALIVIHRDPAADWSLAALAAEAGLSRSAFAARFAEKVGMPAMRYVTYWRMQLARERLTGTDAALAAIAADLGYRSEPAFHRAFKRIFGEAPGQVRRRAAG